MSRAAAEAEAALRKIVAGLLLVGDNGSCADCKQKGPRWASTNLGVFICIRCSGIHRSMGTHISKVRSTDLDRWTPEQVKDMQSMGNTLAAQIWEYHLPADFRRPGEHDAYAAESFIKAKYVNSQWKRKASDPPLVVAAPVAAAAAAAAGPEKERKEKSEKSERSHRSDKHRDERREKRREERRERERAAGADQPPTQDFDLLGLNSEPVGVASVTVPAPPASAPASASVPAGSPALGSQAGSGSAPSSPVVSRPASLLSGSLLSALSAAPPPAARPSVKDEILAAYSKPSTPVTSMPAVSKQPTYGLESLGKHFQ